MLIHTGHGFVTTSKPNSRLEKVVNSNDPEAGTSTLRMDQTSPEISGRDLLSDGFSKSKKSQSRVPKEQLNTDQFSKSITYIKDGRKMKLDVSPIAARIE